MNFFSRMAQRILILLICGVILWLCISEVFYGSYERLFLFFTFALLYIICAYVIFPPIIHFSVMVFKRGRIPRTTFAPDGLPADPVNIILVGTREELFAAFKTLGWHKADRLTIQSIWKMGENFILNKPYPQAPFSSLFIFGRTQDFGFQESIGNSPRKRNHIRFWAANIDPEAELSDIEYWLTKHPIDQDLSHIWVGAGTRDTGFGFQSLTYQMTHRTDAHIDEEREYIFNALRQKGLIESERYISPGEKVAGKYISDGKILWGKLKLPVFPE